MDREVLCIQIGEFVVGRGAVSIETYALGSCVGLCMWDGAAQIGGMAHILLPDSSAIGRATKVLRNSDLCKYADHACTLLSMAMTHMGASSGRMVALVAGGANMFSFGAQWMNGQQVGEKNVQAVLNQLHRLQIPVSMEDTGGKNARSIRFDVDTGTLSTISRERGMQAVHSISTANAKNQVLSAADMLQAARNAVR